MTPGLTPAVDGDPTVHVHEVVFRDNGDRLHANLERPTAGESIEGFCVPLVGWALSPGGESVEIQISDSHEVLRCLARRMRRPDIAEVYPGVGSSEASGFSLAFDAVTLPCEFDLRIAGNVGGEALPFARIAGSRQRFEPAQTHDPAPLMVTTLGRTGSTLLMTLLSLHPSIMAYHPVAHDSRPFAYWLDAAIAMASPNSHMQLLDSTGQDNAWWLGPVPVPVETFHRLEQPVRRLLLRDEPETLLQAAIARASEFAARLARAEEREGTSYAAEKCWAGHVPRLLSELSAECREIFLVRDFRDVLASILAFNAKRGYPAFGREHVNSDEQFLERLALDVEALAQSFDERGERSLLIRYEELVEDPGDALTDIFDYLGLESSPSSVAAIVERGRALLDTTRADHRTTEKVSASSGRWQRDLTPALQQACTEAFEGPLRRFGYL